MYTSDDLNKLLSSATRALVEDVANAVLCSIRILKEGRLISMSHYSSDESPDRPEMEEFIPIGDGKSIRTVGGDAILTKEIQEVPDLSKDWRFSNHKIISAGFASMMAVPIIFNDRALGVAQIYSKTQGYRFTKKEKSIAQMLVNNLAHVLVIKEQAEEIMHLQEKALEAAIHKLTVEHTAVIHHHFKNKLTIIGGFLGLILKHLDDTEKVERFTRIGATEIDNLERIMFDVLNFAKKAPKKSQVSLAELASSAMNSFEAINGIQIEKDIRTRDSIAIDQTQIELVITELLQNAKKASESNGGLKITCRLYPYQKGAHDSLCLEIENKGTIPTEIIERIFDPFFTTDRQNGTGLGLTHAKMIVEGHGGAIIVSSKNGYTSFRIYLPRN